MIDDYENWEDSGFDDDSSSISESIKWIWVKLHRKSTGSNLDICICAYSETTNILECIEDLFPDWILIVTYLKDSPT